MRNDDLLVLLAIGYFFLGVFQLILALVFTIRRSVLKKGFRGWTYYWIAVGVYFIGLLGCRLLLEHHYDALSDSFAYSEGGIVTDNYDTWSKRAELLKLITGIWFFTSTLIAIYFFFAGKVSDRIAFDKEQNHIHN